MSEMQIEVRGLGEFRSGCRFTVFPELFFQSAHALVIVETQRNPAVFLRHLANSLVPEA